MVFVLDNYDSFTYNLVQYLGELGADVVVRRNDELSVDEVEALKPDRILLSPGPCTPGEAGILVPLIRRMAGKAPILGVCLGHQAIGEAFGARVVRGDVPVHGKVTEVHHRGERLFEGCPDPMQSARYHSLVVDRATLPEDFTVDAESGDGAVMAISHRELPIFGIQFHPESYGTAGGDQLIRNFLFACHSERSEEPTVTVEGQ